MNQKGLFKTLEPDISATVITPGIDAHKKITSDTFHML